ncbi:MAG: N-acetylneuraminate synthase family protein [Treponema sp.]|jgi:sialic acid synthase SpsE|nr:N-acetylneuraminate synthase family protein [Treponema sp.]
MKNFETKNFEVNGVVYSPRNVLVIAELGTAHGGDPVKARELIAAAAEAGANCIKFQMVYAGEILHPRTGEVPLPGGRISLYERFRQLERGPDFYAEMKAQTEARGILFLCTPFGPRSLRELSRLQPSLLKIASPELNYTRLLKKTAACRIPLLLSSGVSRLSDIEDALSIVYDEWALPEEQADPSRPSVCLMHCITSYPAPETEYNLMVLQSLSAVFGVSTGLSDHSLDPELVPGLAVAMGAAAVEKHFCLSRSDPGLDDPIALPPQDFKRMTAAIRRASAADTETCIEELARERGSALVEAVLGNGVKRLAPSEKANYERTNRSIHALRDIARGETITADAIGVLRTEKVLRPGLPPVWENRITGRTARNFIPAGEGIRFEDI